MSKSKKKKDKEAPNGRCASFTISKKESKKLEKIIEKEMADHPLFTTAAPALTYANSSNISNSNSIYNPLDLARVYGYPNLDPPRYREQGATGLGFVGLDVVNRDDRADVNALLLSRFLIRLNVAMNSYSIIFQKSSSEIVFTPRSVAFLILLPAALITTK